MEWVKIFFTAIGVAVTCLIVLIVPMAILAGALSKWTPKEKA